MTTRFVGNPWELDVAADALEAAGDFSLADKVRYSRSLEDREAARAVSKLELNHFLYNGIDYTTRKR